MKGRVFIFSPHAPEHPGGVEHFVREIRRGLQEKGYSVDVLSRENCLPNWLIARKGRIGRSLSDAALSWYIGRQFLRNQSDEVCAVISNSAVGWYVPRLRGSALKLFHVYHGTYCGQADAIRPFVSWAGYWKMKLWDGMVLERYSGRGKTVFCCSDPIREEVQKFFGYHGQTIWYPLDVNRFKPLNQRESRHYWGIEPTAPVGVFVGNIATMKNFQIVRALIERLPQIHWILALRGEIPGDLPKRSTLRVLQDVPPDQLPLIYNAASFSLCPSRYDPFPYVVPESLACGTPVIAAPHGSSRFFLNVAPLDRLLIPGADDVDSFVGAAEEVVRDPEYFRTAVMDIVRPRVLAVMSPDNWWAKFSQVTGL